MSGVTLFREIIQYPYCNLRKLTSPKNHYGQVIVKYFTFVLGPRKIAVLQNDVQLFLRRQNLCVPRSRCAPIDFFLSAEFSLD